MRARADGSARELPTRWRLRDRSTREWESSAASGSRSTSPSSRPRQHLTLVHKTNVLTFAGDLWQRTFDEVADDYRACRP